MTIALQMRWMVRSATAAMVACATMSLAAQTTSPQATGAQALTLTGSVRGTHDPSIALDHGTYYVFATGAVHNGYTAPPPAPAGSQPVPPVAHRNALLPQFQVRCSSDLHAWRLCGSVFPHIPDWIQKLSPETDELWAPDISYFDGEYHLYYAFSAFGKNTSGIALATTPTLDPASPKFGWVDRGLVLQSFATDDFNAIDPNLILDEKGGAWLSFGSFWKGIMMRRLDRSTGLLAKSDTKVYPLASRYAGPLTQPRDPKLPPDAEAVEAPFIVRHGSYYYLFVSFDLCCRGTRSTYRTMVGRSAAVTGPYVDREGRPMLAGGGSPLLSANKRWLGPGGESVLQHDGTDYIVFHAYDAMTGMPSLQISTLDWTGGWPAAALAGDEPAKTTASDSAPTTTGQTSGSNQ